MTTPTEYVEKHPKLRWYVPGVVTATFLMHVWEVFFR